MKKLLTILLTLALTLSLAVPALAEEAVAVPTWQEHGAASLAEYLADNFWTETTYYAYAATEAERLAWLAAYEAAHPDEVAAFDADAYFAQRFSHYEGKAEYLTDFEIADEAEFRTHMLSAFIIDQELEAESKTQWAAIQAQEPQRVAEFLVALPTYLAENHTFSTIEDYLEQGYGLSTDQAYVDLYQAWNWEYEYQQRQQAEHDKKITDLGGTPGQINVLLNDKCLALTPGQIKAIDGAVSLPSDVLSKTLGVTVKGDAQGYAPVRAAAEGAGYEVFWDGDYQTVVLVDRQGVVDGLNAQFTQLQALIDGALKAFQGKEGQAYAASESVTADVTLFNTLDGDSSYTLRCKLTTLRKDGNLSGTITLDVAALLRQLSAEEKEALNGLLPSTLTLGQLITLAAGLEVNFVWDVNQGRLAFNIPALAALADGMEKDTWVNLDMGGLTGLEGQGVTIGDLIYTAVAPFKYYYNDYLGYYTEIMHQASLYTDLLGNDRFTRQGETLTYKMDTKTANTIVKSFYQNDPYTAGIGDVFRNADITMSLTEGGKLAASFHLRPNMNALSGAIPGLGMIMSLVDFDYQGQATATPQKVQMTAQLHWKNQFKAKLTVTSAIQETAKTVAAAPAAEDCLDQWDFMALLGTLFSGVAD